MAPRAISAASITFGLVNIPVKLYSAANPRSNVSFKMLSKEGHKLKQQYIDPQNGGEVVPRSEMVKGYEYAKDKYVIFTPEELAELQEKSTQQIEITEFVPESTVPRVYFDKTYYLGPDKGGDRAYKLLSEAMKQTGRTGLARYSARGKQYLVLIAPMGDAVAMHQLHYADELVDVNDIPLGDADPKDEELALATQIINQISTEEFRPDQYEDEVRKRVEGLIERKVAGEEIVSDPVEEEAPAGVTDLMAQLKASLGADKDKETKDQKAS
ncbi:MAG: Ku protein [Myxococcota bacterium]